jgi:hypothetical protein
LPTAASVRPPASAAASSTMLISFGFARAPLRSHAAGPHSPPPTCPWDLSRPSSDTPADVPSQRSLTVCIRVFREAPYPPPAQDPAEPPPPARPSSPVADQCSGNRTLHGIAHRVMRSGGFSAVAAADRDPTHRPTCRRKAASRCVSAFSGRHLIRHAPRTRPIPPPDARLLPRPALAPRRPSHVVG